MQRLQSIPSEKGRTCWFSHPSASAFTLSFPGAPGRGIPGDRSLIESSSGSRRSDIHLLYAARALRGLDDGSVIILPVYLAAVGYGSFAIDTVAAAALLGPAALASSRGGTICANFCSSLPA
jgi:hypothetical protein